MTVRYALGVTAFLIIAALVFIVAFESSLIAPAPASFLNTTQQQEKAKAPSRAQALGSQITAPLTCRSFLWQEDAQEHARANGAGGMDADGDGVVCESLPSRAKRDSYGGTFKGYPCTSDCSGHEAGYNWAEENGISSADECGGNSNSFIEGCESYVEENFPSENTDYDEYPDYPY